MQYRKKDFVPTDRWNTPYTTGMPLMVNAGTKVMTVGADTVSLSVPKGERWVVFSAYMKNVSAQQIACYIDIVDKADVTIQQLVSQSAVANGNSIDYPNGSTDLVCNAVPLILFEGQKIRFTWGALAGKSGTSYYYVDALQFDVGKGT